MPDTQSTRAWLAPLPGYRKGEPGPHWHGRATLHGLKYALRATHLPTGALEVEMEVLRAPQRGLTRHFRGVAVPGEQRHRWNGVVAVGSAGWAVDAVRCIPPLPELPDGTVRARYAILRIDLSPSAKAAPDPEGPVVD